MSAGITHKINDDLDPSEVLPQQHERLLGGTPVLLVLTLLYQHLPA